MVNTDLTSSQNNLSGSTATNLVFIDTAVANFSSLLAGLKPNTQAIVLDPAQDGISQITNFLSQHSGIVDSIQILGHGAAGMLQLGSTRLSSDNLTQYQSALSTWFSPQLGKTKTPDLLLYGCDVASGDVGENFIQKLSQITGADVAASVDLTGSAAKGGNWILEKATGVIEAGQAFTRKVRDAYEDVLATFTVKNTNDSGVDSLRQAIIDANATPLVADDIVFNIGSGGVQTIKLQSALPVITSQINLDGTTQPGSLGKPMIELRGDAIPDAGDFGSGFVNGLTFWGVGSSNSVARGFIINRFQGNGIKVGEGYQANNTPPQYIQGPSNVTIDNNYIGTDRTGTVALPNSWSSIPDYVNGVYAHFSPGTRITNNLISGNATTAIIIREQSTNVVITGNYIGTDISGNLPLGNQRAATYVNNSSNNLLYQNNLVAANGYDNDTDGIEMFWTYNTTGMQIRNNSFGFSQDGSKLLRNRGNVIGGGGASPNPNTLTDWGSATPPTVTGNTYPGGGGGLISAVGNNLVTKAWPASPTLSTIGPKLTDVTNDPLIANPGSLIKDLVSGSIKGDGVSTSADYGIAITAVNDTGGVWQYSIDDGKEWNSIADALSPVGYGKSKSTSGNQSQYIANFQSNFLLSPDNKNRVRFLPNPGFAGTVTNGVTYKAWNQSIAGNGLLLNSGGGRYNVSRVTDSLSTNTDNFSVKVTKANKAPVLDPALVQSVSSIPVNPVTNPGTLVTALIPGLAVTDPDIGDLKGIAVTAVDNSNGTWEYTLDGTIWLAFGSPTATSARLLPADGTTKVRFVPDVGYEGTPEINFRAWDQTNGVAGGIDNASINGGITPYSNSLGKVAIAVGNVIIPSTPTTPSIDPEILKLLRNPDAPATPKPVVVGELPKNDDGAIGQGESTIKSLMGGSNLNGAGATGNPNGGNTGNSAENDDCGCEAIIKQQVPNPVMDTIRGTKDKDFLTGTASVNTIYGLQDDDTITGTSNADNLYGGRGNDLIRGGRGRDFIQGGQGADAIYGGRGNDVIIGGQGADTIYGGRGADMLFGGNGNDLIYGGRGNDFISGGKGNDRLLGGAGNDTLCGCEGDDFLRGGRGNDILKGGKGNDILVGGFGDDILTGGAGKDRFRFAPGTGTDTITDFSVGEDLIELVKGLKFSDLQITQGVGATVISFQPGSLFASDKPLALLTGVNAASLTPNSFLVV